MTGSAVNPAKPRKRVQDRWWWPLFSIFCFVFSAVIWGDFGLLSEVDRAINQGFDWIDAALVWARQANCDLFGCP